MSRWGRAHFIALGCATAATVVMGAVLYLVAATEAAGGELLMVAVPSYFTAMTGIGVAAQAPNVTERLPGARRWDPPPAPPHENTPTEDLP